MPRGEGEVGAGAEAADVVADVGEDQGAEEEARRPSTGNIQSWIASPEFVYRIFLAPFLQVPTRQQQGIEPLCSSKKGNRQLSGFALAALAGL